MQCEKMCTRSASSHGTVIGTYLRHFVRVETAEPRYSSCLLLFRISFFFTHFISFLTLSPSTFPQFLLIFCFFLTPFLSVFPSNPSFPFQITFIFLSYVLWLVVSNFPPYCFYVSLLFPFFHYVCLSFFSILLLLFTPPHSLSLYYSLLLYLK
jgi:hypothetical protein